MVMEKKCPVCGTHLPNKLIFEYFFYGTSHEIKCPVCGHCLRPIKEPIPFMLCYFIGLISMILPMLYFLFIRGYDFVYSLCLTLPLIILEIITACIITFVRIRFQEVKY